MGRTSARANIVIAQTLVRALESALARKEAANSAKVASAVDLANVVDCLDPRRRLGFRGRRRETAPVLCRPRDFPLSPYR